MAGFVLLVVAFVVYFLPTFVASNRKHVNGTSIFLVNLLLGWTFLGWVVALVWASSANTERSVGNGATSSAVSDDRACPLCAETIKLAAIKCKHCGAEIAAGTTKPDQVIPEASTMQAATATTNDPDSPKTSSIQFRFLCFALICIIIGAAVYHLTKTAPAIANQPQQKAYEPRADELVVLGSGAFGCMSLADFERAQDHYNRAEYSAWAEITTDKYCFFRRDGDAEIAWTVLQVRDDLMQIGIKRASEYSKNPELGKFNYWTLKRWASPRSPSVAPTQPAEAQKSKT